MRQCLFALAGLVGMTAPAAAQVPAKPPVILISCKLSESAAPGGEPKVLSETVLATMAGRQCGLSCGLTDDLPVDFYALITPGELNDCKFRLQGDVECVRLTKEGGTAEERRRCVRVPLPPSAMPGRRERLELRTDGGKAYVFEFEVSQLEEK